MKRIFIQSFLVVALLFQHWDMLAQCTISVAIQSNCDGTTTFTPTLGTDVTEYNLEINNGAVAVHLFANETAASVSVPTNTLADGFTWVATAVCPGNPSISDNGTLSAGTDLDPGSLTPTLALVSEQSPSCPGEDDGIITFTISDPAGEAACSGITYNVTFNGAPMFGGPVSAGQHSVPGTGTAAGAYTIAATIANTPGTCFCTINPPVDLTGTLADGTDNPPYFDVTDLTDGNGQIVDGTFDPVTEVVEETVVNTNVNYVIPAGDCVRDVCFSVSGLGDDFCSGGTFSAAFLFIDGAFFAEGTPGIDISGNAYYTLCADGLAAGTHTIRIDVNDDGLPTNQFTTVTFDINVAEEDPNPTVIPLGDFNFDLPNCTEYAERNISFQVTDGCDSQADINALAGTNLTVQYTDYSSNPAGTTVVLTGDDAINTVTDDFFEFTVNLTLENDGEEIIASFTDSDGNTDVEYYEISVSQAAGWDLTLACNDRVNVTLNEYNCMAELLPDNVLEGFPSGQDCTDGFYVKVAYPYDGHSINSVRKCGEFKYIAYEIVGGPDWDDSGATGDIYPDKEVCWGYVNAEDKTPPTGCIRKVVGLHKRPQEYYKEGDYVITGKVAKKIDDYYWKYDPVTCDQYACDDDIKDYTYLDSLGTNLLICTDVDSILNITESYTDKKYAYYTGKPELNDNCNDWEPKVIEVHDELHDFQCDYHYYPSCVPGRLVSAVIYRTFIFEDEKGNRNEVVQEICFFKPLINMPNCKEVLDVCWYGDVDEDNTEEELSPNKIHSVPTYTNGICMTMPLDEHVCNVTVTYEDLVLPGPEKCGFKVIRNWTLLDWCWNPGIYDGIDLIYDPYYCYDAATVGWHDKSLRFEQHLIIGDDTDPYPVCPDTDWDGEPGPMVFSTGPFDCNGAFDVPAPVLDNKECAYTWTVEIYANVPVLWHGVPTGDYELVHFKDANVIVDNDITTWETRSVKVVGVPKGRHYLKYIVEDHCGNVGYSYDYCEFYIIDEVEPIAVCDDDLTVSIASGEGGDANPYGFGRVYARDVDEGSWDNCTDTWLQVRRFVPEDCVADFEAGSNLSLNSKKVTIDKPGTQADGLKGYWTKWADYVDFVCCDIGTHPEEGKVLVELGVWDNANMSFNDKGEPIFGDNVKPFPQADFKQEDNFNTCWLEVLLEDKIAPVCTAPHDMYLSCEYIPYEVYIPEDGTKWEDLSEDQQGHLRDWFSDLQDAEKSYPKAWDNCDVTIEMVDVRFNVHCKSGYIERRFQATDAWGRTSGVCKHRIYLSRHHDYCIKFPKDAEAECLEDPEIPGVELFEYACDLLAVSVQDERFDVPTSSDECYKLFRTYRVLNWCQFDEDVDPGTPLFDRFDTFYDMEPLVVSRDEDEDGKPGDEDVYVRFYGWENDKDYKNELDRLYDDYGLTIGYEDDEEGTYGYTYIDNNCDPYDYEHYDPTEGYFRYAHYTRGFYQYTQVIKVYDAIPPVVTGIGDDKFPSYASPDPDDKESDFANGLPTVCVGEVSIDVQVSETCTPDYVAVKAVYLLPDADLGVPNLLIYDGAVTDAGADFGFAVSEGVTGDAGTVFTLTGSFPIGYHEMEVHASDGCGNVDAEYIPFEVYDAKAPAPICISGLSVELMPDGEGGGAMSIWATDFIASDIWDCSEPIKYTIHRADEIDAILAAGDEVTFGEDDHSLTVTCDDPEVVLVYIYGWDAAGNGDRCEAMLLINDFMGLCGPVAGAAVAGLISTEEDESVSDVQVQLSGQMNDEMMTSNTGNYGFNGLDMGYDYTVTPNKDLDYKNGVSTFDLVVISKHILGVELLDSPYKMIAADANNSRSITTLDLIQFRRLILSIDVELRNNTSWRFVDAKYQFPNPANPWQSQFPEVININDLEEDMMSGDFVAVKIGDVTGDAAPNESARPRSIQGTFTLNVEDQALVAGNEYRVTFEAADFANIQGYQFTLNFAGGVEFVDVEYGVAQEENFGFAFLNDRAITTSWNGDAQTGEMFTLVFQATKEVQLSEVLTVGSRYTAAEAYNQDDELLDVAIDFGTTVASGAEFELYQNTPNPFNGETKIGFNLPEAASATITIHDVAGKALRVIRRDFAKGYNEVVIDEKGLVPGVMFYTLESDDFTATKKMILSK